MPSYKVSDDLIVFLNQEVTFTSGSSQAIQLILYRDNIGTQLNASAATSITANVLDSQNNLLLSYSNVSSSGLSGPLTIGSPSNSEQGYINFTITGSQSSTLPAGGESGCLHPCGNGKAVMGGGTADPPQGARRLRRLHRHGRPDHDAGRPGRTLPVPRGSRQVPGDRPSPGLRQELVPSRLLQGEAGGARLQAADLRRPHRRGVI